jgi:hypothetical protein
MLAEKELAQELKIGYSDIATDHCKPENKDVDRFIEFVKSLESDAALLIVMQVMAEQLHSFACMT